MDPAVQELIDAMQKLPGIVEIPVENEADQDVVLYKHVRTFLVMAAAALNAKQAAAEKAVTALDAKNAETEFLEAQLRVLQRDREAAIERAQGLERINHYLEEELTLLREQLFAQSPSRAESPGESFSQQRLKRELSNEQARSSMLAEEVDRLQNRIGILERAIEENREAELYWQQRCAETHGDAIGFVDWKRQREGLIAVSDPLHSNDEELSQYTITTEVIHSESSGLLQGHASGKSDARTPPTGRRRKKTKSKNKKGQEVQVFAL